MLSSILLVIESERLRVRDNSNATLGRPVSRETQIKAQRRTKRELTTKKILSRLKKSTCSGSHVHFSIYKCNYVMYTLICIYVYIYLLMLQTQIWMINKSVFLIYSSADAVKAVYMRDTQLAVIAQLFCLSANNVSQPEVGILCWCTKQTSIFI